MAVRWIGDAARELTIEVWDAIALLANQDEYPMNGLLDEERFQLLKRAAKKAPEAVATPPPPPPPPVPPTLKTGVTEVTAPLPTLDKSDQKTVIYPPQS